MPANSRWDLIQRLKGSKHFRSSPFAVSVHTQQSPIYTSSSPSPIPSCYWFFYGCPTPVHVFCHCGEVKKFSYSLPETHSYVLENPRIFAAPNRICWNTGTEFSKTHETRTVPGIPERIESPILRTT